MLCNQNKGPLMVDFVWVMCSSLASDVCDCNVKCNNFKYNLVIDNLNFFCEITLLCITRDPINSLMPSNAYMRQLTNHHWLR